MGMNVCVDRGTRAWSWVSKDSGASSIVEANCLCGHVRRRLVSAFV